MLIFQNLPNCFHDQFFKFDFERAECGAVAVELPAAVVRIVLDGIRAKPLMFFSGLVKPVAIDAPAAPQFGQFDCFAGCWHADRLTRVHA